MRKKTREKSGIILGIIVVSAVLLTLALYAASAGPIDLTEIFLILIVAIIALAAVFVVIRKMRAVRSGLPADDELSQRIKTKAGYYTFLATIWIALGICWADMFMTEDFGLSGLSVGQAIGAIIILSALVFFGLYFYFSRIGKVD